jgi:hypothetical protein
MRSVATAFSRIAKSTRPSVLRQMKRNPARAAHSWLGRLTARSHPHIAAVALANKNARIAWALLALEREYQADYRARVAPAPV